MNTPPDLLPCPSKEAGAWEIADEAAAILLSRFSFDTLTDEENLRCRMRMAGREAIHLWVSRHSASTVDVERVERVAKVLCDRAARLPGTYERISECGRDPWREDARAAIEACEYSLSRGGGE